MKRMLRKYLRLLRGRDKGTVAVTFLLSLPVLLFVIGVLVQFALLANARLTLDRALAAAARSAMTSLPTDPAIDGLPGLPPMNGANNVSRSALMILESLSPASPDTTSDATTVAEALAETGVQVPATYAARYAYAQQSMQMQITPLNVNTDYRYTTAPRVRITISYDFMLTVPGVNLGIAPLPRTVAGVTGRFFTLTRTLDNVQLSPGREVSTDNAGDPQ